MLQGEGCVGEVAGDSGSRCREARPGLSHLRPGSGGGAERGQHSLLDFCVRRWVGARARTVAGEECGGVCEQAVVDVADDVVVLRLRRLLGEDLVGRRSPAGERGVESLAGR